MKKKILLGLGVVFILIQFIRHEKNISNDNTMAIGTKYEVPQDVKHILEVACNDCHSNKTNYPWYSYVQPVSWWLNHHITDGKRHLNYSAFTKLPIAVQNHKFEETVEMMDKKAMPLASYTYLGMHKEARLNDQQRQIISDWAKAQMEMLKTQYPPDSLVMRRRNPPPSK